MKIYTKGGDAGETSLLGDERVRKDDPRIEAYGTVDETSSAIGVARAVDPDSDLDTRLHEIQTDLFQIGACLASTTDDFRGVAADRVTALEQSIDEMEATLEPLTSFIFPGGSEAGALLHFARTVCRRAERLVSALEIDQRGEHTIIYLNRLSDWLFVAARTTNRNAGIGDIPWQSKG